MKNTLSCRTLNKHGIYYDDLRKSVAEFYEDELEGTEFRKSVWSILQTIPYGKTITYGEIGSKLLKTR